MVLVCFEYLPCGKQKGRSFVGREAHPVQPKAAYKKTVRSQGLYMASGVALFSQLRGAFHFHATRPDVHFLFLRLGL